EIVAEQNVTSGAWTNYVFFGGDRVARREYPSGDVSYYFSDHLKTASVITDAAGTVKAESDYYPWGGELQFVANDSNHYKFTGKERDSESGLDYFGARYYSNGLGRWVSADWSAMPEPVPYADFGDPQSLNLYGFVGGNPASKADADGHGEATEKAKALAQGIWIWIDVLSNPRTNLDNLGQAADYALQKTATGLRNCGCSPPSDQQQDGKKNNNNSQSTNQSEKSGSNVQENRKAGLEYEKEVLDKRGLDKNTKPMEATDPKTGKSGTTIPDSTENGATVEVKGGKSVSDSPQLRRQTEISKQAGQKAQVIVKPNTKVSNTVRERMDVKEQK